MNRRDFLRAMLAGIGALLIPETKPVNCPPDEFKFVIPPGRHFEPPIRWPNHDHQANFDLLVDEKDGPIEVADVDNLLFTSAQNMIMTIKTNKNTALRSEDAGITWRDVSR